MEDKYKNRPCLKPEQPSLSGAALVNNDGAFSFKWSHKQIPNNAEKYELLEYSHVDMNNWLIAPCWNDRQSMWRYTDIDLGQRGHDTSAEVTDARQGNNYGNFMFFRLRAWNNCGTASKWSNPVWYKQEGNSWTSLSDWMSIRGMKCQEDTGERPDFGLSDADWARVEALKNAAAAKGLNLSSMSRAEKTALEAEVNAAAAAPSIGTVLGDSIGVASPAADVGG